MVTTQNALEQLIRQFSQPLSFLRELVQNSLDAESTTVEITVERDSSSGSIFIQVQDNGEGMTEEVIDKRLTRLFSSTKEDDLTKIGKFGIGFVSIFAMKPELVVLETGSDGENWRVLFKPDRSFEKRRMHQRTDGTSVTLFLPAGKDSKSLNQLATEAKTTVAFWCKYSATDILFNGELINEVFGFQDTPYQFRYKHEGAEAALTPSVSENGFQGYYNRGLTLLEGPGSPIPHLSFRLRSKYLEHTLSRDNILHDENYQKAMAHLSTAALKEMPRDLFGKLAHSDDTSLWQVATHALKIPGVRDEVEHLEVIPTTAGRLSLEQLPKELIFWHEEDSLWHRALTSVPDLIMVKCSPGTSLYSFLEAQGFEFVELSQSYLFYQKEKPTDDEERLLRLLGERAGHLNSPFIVSLESAPGGITNADLGFFLNPTKQARATAELSRQSGDSVALVRNSKLLSKVVCLAAAEPELAIAVLVRKLHLDLGLGKKREKKLLAEALQRLKIGSENS